MEYKIKRIGLVIFLLSILSMISGTVTDNGWVVVVGLIVCAISAGLIVDNDFFRRKNDNEN